MRILVITHESEFTGGANRSLFSLLEYWRKKDIVEFEVLFPCSYGECVDSLKQMGGVNYYAYKYYKVFSERKGNPSDLLRKGKVYLKYYYNKMVAKVVANKLKGQNYDLVYSNTRMTSMGMSIAKSLGIPHIMHIREFGNQNTIWGPANIKNIYKNSAGIIAISNALADFLAESIPRNSLIISHNGMSYYDNNCHCAVNKDKKTTDILITGRITAAKAQHKAIEALHILVEQGYENVILHLAGSTSGNSKQEISYRDNIDKMVKRYNLERHTVFHGEVKDMKKLRAAMDIELMCAERETFGRVTVEAMRSGLLVIGADTGATVEIIEDKKTGLTYRQDDAHDLAYKIIWAMENPEEVEKIRRAGCDFSYNHFTIEKNSEDIVSLLKEVIDRR